MESTEDSKKSSYVSTSSPSSELNMVCSHYTQQHEKHLLFLVDKEHYYSQAHSSPEDELFFLVFITSLSLTLYRLMCTVSLLGTNPCIWTWYCPHIKSQFGAGEMALPLRALVLAGNWGLVPSIHIWWVTTAHNSSCRASDNLSWPPWAPAHGAQTDMWNNKKIHL